MSNFIEAEHYSQVPPEAWPWKSFTPEEIACRGTGKIKISKFAMARLQALRDALGCPMIINSAYRSPEHNKRVGGAKNSYHVQGLAFDVSMANHDPEDFERKAKVAGFTGLGFYPPKKGEFIHIDVGPVAARAVEVRLAGEVEGCGLQGFQGYRDGMVVPTEGPTAPLHLAQPLDERSQLLELAPGIGYAGIGAMNHGALLNST